jgi:poly(ADP-ribose) glycohydrolase ARH3
MDMIDKSVDTAAARAGRLDRTRGALLGAFVGDALGMPFEGLPPERIPEYVSMVEARLGAGTYTDDTEMMINLGESLVVRGTIEQGHLALRFLHGHDRRRGYGGGTLEVFSLWRSGCSVEAAAGKLFGGEGSQGNGAAMRVAALAAFMPDAADLLEQAGRSARVTHRHPIGIDAARVQCAAVAAAVRGEDPLGAAIEGARTSTMVDRLRDTRKLLGDVPSPAEAAFLLGNTPLASESVPLAIYSAVAHEDFEEAVTFAVRCGGDTDTTAAMAGAIAGAQHGAQSISRRWLETLEDGDRGRSYVEQLARQFLETPARGERRA